MDHNQNPSVPSVLAIITDGSEDMEAVITIDTLRRAKIHVVVASASTTDSLVITAARGVRIKADTLLTQISDSDTQFDVIFLPGGGGATSLGKNKLVISLLKKHIASKKLVAAICAAPAVVLEANGLLKCSKATCWPSLGPKLGDKFSTTPVVHDGNFITGQGPFISFEFALKIISVLISDASAEKVAEGLLYKKFAE